ncbi:unnamed protein product, partial [Mesorhabditis belari]|uniref:Neuroguidin n=1 Tax=Mesorhabditis belari TaxID=2138241 RepID=A0AAF3J5V3_9BILA
MASDASRFARAAIDCEKTSTEAIDCVEKLLAGLKQDSDRDGISLLEVKNHDLLAYLTDMAFLMERMSSGGSIQVGGSVERTTKYRTVLERIKPIEKKMEAQITKLVQETSSKQKPSVSVVSEKEGAKEGATSESEVEDESEANEARKRVPTKILAVQNTAERDAERKEKRVEKNKKRALRSTLVQELRQQYSEAPVEEYNDVIGSDRVRQLDRDRLE